MPSGNCNGRVSKLVDGVLVEAVGLKCYAVNEGEQFRGFIFAHDKKSALEQVKTFGRGFQLVGLGFSVTLGFSEYSD